MHLTGKALITGLSTQSWPEWNKRKDKKIKPQIARLETNVFEHYILNLIKYKYTLTYFESEKVDGSDLRVWWGMNKYL